jgi:hypothetical protein
MIVIRVLMNTRQDGNPLGGKDACGAKLKPRPQSFNL